MAATYLYAIKSKNKISHITYTFPNRDFNALRTNQNYRARKP